MHDVLSRENLIMDDILLVFYYDVRSSLEFACVLEASMQDGQLARPNERQESSPRLSINSALSNTFGALAAHTNGELNLPTLEGVLPNAPETWPTEIKLMWESVIRLPARPMGGSHYKYYSVPFILVKALDRYDERTLEIMALRIFPARPVHTLAQFGQKYGITRERVRQLEALVKKRLVSLQESASFQPVVRRASVLQKRLGTSIPCQNQKLAEALTWATRDFTGYHWSESRTVRWLANPDEYNNDEGNENPQGIDIIIRLFLIWLAGPYKERKGWLLADPELEGKTVTALRSHSDHRGLITSQSAENTLNELGINNSFHLAWIKQFEEFRRVEGGYIFFKGSILDKAYALLRFMQRPLSVADILEILGNGSLRSVRQRLMDDPRFWRVNVQGEFVIAGTSGYSLYIGIVEQLIEEIDACGGSSTIQHLVRRMISNYGVKETSVIAYLNTPKFARDDSGLVIIRKEGEYYSTDIDLSNLANCYKTLEGNWQWRVYIDRNLKRGSGRRFPNAFAKLFGCDVGDKLEVPSTFGPITLSWPSSSIVGATIGSLRAATEGLRARLGDHLFIQATKPIITFRLLKRKDLERASSQLVQLSLLLGRSPQADESDALEYIARTLGIQSLVPNEIYRHARHVLLAKGEPDLAAMLEASVDTIDDHLTELARLLN